MEGIYIGIIILCLVLLILTRLQMYKQTKEIRQMEEDIQHFILYPEDVKEEYLEEGCVYNLMNQVLKLESQILYDRKTFQNKEMQTNNFIENMAHQIKTAITALHIRLDFSLEICENPKQQNALEKSLQCLERLTSEVERLLTTSQLASGNVMIVSEKLDLDHSLPLHR